MLARTFSSADSTPKKTPAHRLRESRSKTDGSLAFEQRKYENQLNGKSLAIIISQISRNRTIGTLNVSSMKTTLRTRRRASWRSSRSTVVTPAADKGPARHG